MFAAINIEAKLFFRWLMFTAASDRIISDTVIYEKAAV